MHHLIIGYGYCGFHLASYLLSHQHRVTAVSRHRDVAWDLPGLNRLEQDVLIPFDWPHEDTIVYYMIPPPATGRQDSTLQQFLTFFPTPLKILYFGSSAVYGNKRGAWVDEQASCEATFERQLRRLDAEKQCFAFAETRNTDCLILRIAGIYGPQRLPVDAARQQTAVIDPPDAPFSNHIYVKDLAAIAACLAIQKNAKGIYNVSDGNPLPMGALQQEVAAALKLSPAPFAPFDRLFMHASPIRREFMQSSKRLNIDALKAALGESLLLTPFATAVRESLKEEGALSC